MNHQARQFDNTKGTLQRPCNSVPACLAHWPEKGQAITTTDHPIISNDLFFNAKAGNRTRLTDPDNIVTNYTFDEVNRLSSVVTTLTGISNYKYDRSSLQTRVDYANGTQAITQYDNARRTTQIRNQQGAAIVSQYDYNYDTNGNRIQQIEINGTATTAAGETTTYQYDSNDRLRRVNYSDASVAYTFDANYNRATEITTSIPGNSVVINKTYNYNN